MKLHYMADTFLHPSKDNGEAITVFEVAKKLEAKYNLLGYFTDLYAEDIKDIIYKASLKWLRGKKQKEEFLLEANAEIKALWLDYIKNEEHGIKTRIALEEDRKSFIDTGTYFLDISPELEL